MPSDLGPFHGWPLLPTGLVAKAFLALGTRTCEIHGLSGLVDLLQSRRRGVLTVSNHVSVVDEPLCWGVLPWRTYLTARQMRWTLGASDIVFKQTCVRTDGLQSCSRLIAVVQPLSILLSQRPGHRDVSRRCQRRHLSACGRCRYRQTAGRSMGACDRYDRDPRPAEALGRSTSSPRAR